MRKLIEVTAEDIKEGKLNQQKDNSRMEDFCPVALALRRGGFPKALVCEGTIQLHGTSRRGTVRMSQNLMQFVRDFDFKNNIGPIRFYIEV